MKADSSRHHSPIKQRRCRHLSPPAPPGGCRGPATLVPPWCSIGPTAHGPAANPSSHPCGHSVLFVVSLALPPPALPGPRGSPAQSAPAQPAALPTPTRRGSGAAEATAEGRSLARGASLQLFTRTRSHQKSRNPYSHLKPQNDFVQRESKGPPNAARLGSCPHSSKWMLEGQEAGGHPKTPPASRPWALWPSTASPRCRAPSSCLFQGAHWNSDQAGVTALAQGKPPHTPLPAC